MNDKTLPPVAAAQSECESPLALRWSALLGAPLLALLMLALGAPDGMSEEAWKVSALAVVMALWWITEALPLPVTSLLPIIVLPVSGLLPFDRVATGYASNIIFLYLGGLIMTLGMEKWGLHRRLALGVLRKVGCNPRAMLAGFMGSTAFLGMWISNTATVLLMLPVCLSIVRMMSKLEDGGEYPLHQNGVAKAIILGVAYASVIGGLSTFIGTPTNAILLGFLQKTYGTTLDLAMWMSFGVPLTLIILSGTWLLLVLLVMRRGGYVSPTIEGDIEHEYQGLGPVNKGERIIMGVFACVITLWTFGPWFEGRAADLGISLVLDDAVIALMGAMAMFLIPTDARRGEFVMHWKDTARLPWGVLVFFGGSLALSAALTQLGVTLWISRELEILSGVNIVLMVMAIVTLIVLMSELMSNVATITAFLPILAALAQAMGINPLLVLVPATLAASCGFMMPGASAPNALAYSTGSLRIAEMVRTGFWADLLAILAITGATFWIVTWALDIETGAVPEWALHTTP